MKPCEKSTWAEITKVGASQGVDFVQKRKAIKKYTRKLACKELAWESAAKPAAACEKNPWDQIIELGVRKGIDFATMRRETKGFTRRKACAQLELTIPMQDSEIKISQDELSRLVEGAVVHAPCDENTPMEVLRQKAETLNITLSATTRFMACRQIRAAEEKLREIKARTYTDVARQLDPSHRLSAADKKELAELGEQANVSNSVYSVLEKVYQFVKGGATVVVYLRVVIQILRSMHTAYCAYIHAGTYAELVYDMTAQFFGGAVTGVLGHSFGLTWAVVKDVYNLSFDAVPAAVSAMVGSFAPHVMLGLFLNFYLLRYGARYMCANLGATSGLSTIGINLEDACDTVMMGLRAVLLGVNAYYSTFIIYEFAQSVVANGMGTWACDPYSYYENAEKFKKHWDESKRQSAEGAKPATSIPIMTDDEKIFEINPRKAVEMAKLGTITRASVAMMWAKNHYVDASDPAKVLSAFNYNLETVTDPYLTKSYTFFSWLQQTADDGDFAYYLPYMQDYLKRPGMMDDVKEAFDRQGKLAEFHILFQ